MYIAEGPRIRHFDLLDTFKSCRGAGHHQQIASKQAIGAGISGTPRRICSCAMWQALGYLAEIMLYPEIDHRKGCEDGIGIRRMQRLPADARFS